MLEFSLSKEMGPRWIIFAAGLGLIASFALGLSNSTMFYALLPKDENADILVFYQPTCPHCIAEIPTIKRLVSEGYRVSAFNVFRYPQLTKKYGVTETPTIIIPKSRAKLEGEQDYNRILAAMHGTVQWYQKSKAGAGCSVNREEITCSPT